jgi:Bacterial Ig-like domain
MKSHKSMNRAVLGPGAILMLGLAGCGGGGSDSASGDAPPGGGTPPPPAPAVTHTIGGSISGLNGSVILQNNGGDDLAVDASGPFTFATAIGTGSNYAVTVLTQPAGQDCLVSGGTGTVAGAAVNGVEVVCATLPLELLSSTPSDGASNVSTTSVISLQFSAQLAVSPDPLSSLVLRSVNGNQSVSIPFTGVVTGSSVSLTPVTALPLLSRHALTVNADLRGLAGENLPAPLTLDFTTSDGQWRSPAEIDGSDETDSYTPRIALDGAGNLVAVWTQYDAPRTNLWASKRTVQGKWETPQLLEADDFADINEVDLAGGGDVIAVWSQSGVSGIWANRHEAGTGWSGAQSIQFEPGSASGPRVDANSRGDALAVWQQFNGTNNDTWASRYVAGSGWGTAVKIDQGAGTTADSQVAIDADGNALAVWAQYSGSRSDIWASRFTVRGGWHAPTLVDSEDAGSATHPKLALDGAGNAVLVWRQSDGSRTHIWASRFEVGRGWQGTTLLQTSLAGTSVEPDVAVDPAGNATVAWSQYDNSIWSIWSTRYDAVAGWGTAALIETQDNDDAHTPRVAADAAGNVTALWSHGSPGSGIYGNRYIPNRGWGQAVAANPGVTDYCNDPWLVVDSAGHVTAVWAQFRFDGLLGFTSVYSNRFE